MNLGLFISNKISSQSVAKSKMSSTVLKLTVLAISLCLATMISSVLIISGFRTSIVEQLVGIDSHVSIKNFDSNQSYLSQPISIKKEDLEKAKNLDFVKSISYYGSKPAILKSKKEIHGIVLKGIDKNYDFEYLKNSIVEGRLINFDTKKKKSNEILISRRVANMLELKVGDKVSVYFVQNPPRARRFKICGIYETNLVKYFDDLIVICDIAHVRKLNKWKKDQVSAYEVRLDKFENLQKAERTLRKTIPNIQKDGTALRISSIKRNYYQIFEWFSLIDINVVVIMIIALFLAIFNISASVLVMVLEQTKTIGILKAIGARNAQIRKIFVHLSIKLLLKGMLWGNAIALILCFIQKQFGIISLNPETYFIDRVPIHFDFISILVVNLLVFVAIVLSLFLPTLVITRIRVSKTIKFD